MAPEHGTPAPPAGPLSTSAARRADSPHRAPIQPVEPRLAAAAALREMAAELAAQVSASTAGGPAELAADLLRRADQVAACFSPTDPAPPPGPHAESELQESARLAELPPELCLTILQHVSEVIFVTDRSGRVLYINTSAAARPRGFTRDELWNNFDWLTEQLRLFSPDGVEIPPTEWPLNRLTRGDAVEGQLVLVKRPATGAEGWFRCSGRVAHDPAGEPIFVLTLRDVSEERAALLALGEAKEQFQQVFDNALVAIAKIDLRTGGYKVANKAYAAILGYTPDELLSMSMHEVTHPDDRGSDRRNLLAGAERGDRVYEVQKRFVRKDGKTRLVRVEAAYVRDEHGIAQEVIGVVADITERKQQEQKLLESERRFQESVDLIPEPIWVLEPNGDPRFLNTCARRLFGDASPSDASTVIHPDDEPRRRRVFSEGIRSRAPMQCDVRVFSPSHNEYRWRLFRATPLIDESGQVKAWYGIGTDIHDLKLAERSLHEEQNRLATTAEAAPGVLNSVRSGPGRGVSFAYVGPNVQSLCGCSPAELRKDGAALLRLVHPDDLRELRRRFLRAAAARAGWNCQFRVAHPQRGQIWVEARYAHGSADEGKVTQHGVLTDITESRQIAERLHETQKMEAVGRLAGGIAHDFNNLLSVILGEAELRIDRLEPHDPSRESFAVIAESATKASHLTRQLLTFSRRQSHSPQVLDLNVLVRSVETLVRRLAGERIQLVIQTSDDPLPVRVDATHLEQALFNLVLNARDAIAGPGVITLQTRLATRGPAAHGLAPAPSAELSVRDTGPGIPPGIADRLFEPFFTTKEVGKGTGLGLAVVHGVAERYGGSVSVTSPSTGGALFRVIIPLAHEQ